MVLTLSEDSLRLRGPGNKEIRVDGVVVIQGSNQSLVLLPFREFSKNGRAINNTFPEKRVIPFDFRNIKGVVIWRFKVFES